jgi:predicted dehydrogenase
MTAASAVAGGALLPDWMLKYDAAQAAATPAPKPLGPNDKPGIALIGCGGQGRGDCSGAAHYGQVVAVCDVDDKQADQAVKQFTRKIKNEKGDEVEKKPEKYKDFRKVMERSDVHVIITGTPDHWHTLVNLAAAQAKKDIYTEKPLTLTIDEGKHLIKAVRSNKVVLQVGSQQRSDRNFRWACELVRNGRIGKLQHILVGLPTGPREGPFKSQPVPEGLDWDFYLGQTPKVDFNGHNYHWNFRWWYQFSGGQMTDWGAHHDDIAQWGNGTELSGPVEVDGESLREMIPGGYDAASQYYIKLKYANGVLMTIRSETIGPRGKLIPNSKFLKEIFSDDDPNATSKVPNGIKFEGTEGWIFVTRGAIKASRDEILNDPLPEGAIKLYKSDNHMGNFFECVRSRKDPICPVEIGHRSISVAHIGVISVRMNRPLKWDPEREIFVGESAAEANRWLSREMRKPYDYSFIA